MMMDPDQFADALYATPLLEAVEARILEMLAASGNEFVPLSVLHEAIGLPHGPFYNACACSLFRTKRKDKIHHILDGLRLAESDEFSYRLPAPLREIVNQWLDDEDIPASSQVVPH